MDAWPRDPQYIMEELMAEGPAHFMASGHPGSRESRRELLGPSVPNIPFKSMSAVT